MTIVALERISAPFESKFERPPRDNISIGTLPGFTAVNGRISHSPPQTMEVASIDTQYNSADRRLSPRHQPQNGHSPPRYRDQSASPGKRKRSPSESETSESTERSSYPPLAPTGEMKRVHPYENADFGGARASADTSMHTSPEAPSNRLPPLQHHFAPPDANGDRNWYPQKRNTISSLTEDEAQMAEALKRDSAMQNRHDGSNGDASQDDAVGLSHTPQPEGQITGTEITAAGVRVDPKKRKRVFSNRTKTGCQTCRKRKKKCDEGKPTCNNCMRGGFECEGYITKSAWPRQPMSHGPRQLQSKNEFPSEPQGGLYPKPSHEQYTAPAQHSRNGHTNEPEEEPRPHHQRSHSAWNDRLPPPASTWTNESSHPPYPPPRASDYSYGPPYSEHQRYPSHEIDRPPSAPNPFSAAPVSNVSRTAQLALQHPSSAINRLAPFSHPVSEKEKMLNGDEYRKYCEQLIEEREACVSALWRFNNAAMNPGMAVSREERHRLFRAILEPAKLKSQPQGRNFNNPRGSLGSDVCVEAPFNCEYGYNINIGDNVVIGANCTILDARDVNIQAKCILGPSVSIYTNAVNPDPARRDGSSGTMIAKPVTIGYNTFVGGHTVINPGVKIGSNCTIAAGSVVTKNIQDGWFAGGNPARPIHRNYTSDKHFG